MLSEFERRKLEKLKDQTTPVSAGPLLKKLFEARDNLNEEEKDILLDSVKEVFTKAGNKILERAFIEGIITEEEWIKINKKYKLDIKDIGTILLVYYSKDKVTAKKGKSFLLTTKESNIYKAKKFVERRFKIKIICAEEAIELMKKEKEDKKNVAR